ncbi:acyltransferase [Pseudomonas syringae group sp. J309-1]|uniref:acyltransferase family protein n=1 Tax=Pseudomonas syringae group sp. J309-1 TaxID=3079588 RepID=UPI00290E1878|nr:acyltransferase [Pseudomonas syringae group sp. J309-1]MDU8361888.1 acyltransferase [Pseudomonas syringae group sp. J309-1]
MHSTNIKYIPQVDHLRAMAALWIVLYHSIQLIGSVMVGGKWFSSDPWPVASSPLTSLLIEGHSAVALFMVLSGFIFTHGTYGREICYSNFIFNRILRIYPLYLLVILLSISASPEKFSASDFITTILPLADVAGLKTNAIAGMSWAVAVEFQFYLIFPFLLTSLNKSPAKTILGVILVAVIFRAIAVGHGANPRDISYSHLIGRIDQFMLGMGAAVLLRSISEKKKTLAVLLGASTVIIVVMLYVLNRHGGWYSNSQWKIFYPMVEGTAYALFIVSYVGTKNMIPSFISTAVTKIGEFSFSIYLLHFPIVLIFASKTALQWHPTAYPRIDLALTICLLTIPCILLVSATTYNVIERPFLSRRKKYIK